MLLKQRRTSLAPFTFHAQIALCIPVPLTRVSEALCWPWGVIGGVRHCLCFLQPLRGSRRVEMLVVELGLSGDRA